MTKTIEEQTLIDYQKFCDFFDIDPIEGAEQVVEPQKKAEKTYPMTAARIEAIKIYKKFCKNLDEKPSTKLSSKPTATIWNYILKVTDIAVKKRFAKELNKIENRNAKIKIYYAIRELYDQEIFVFPEDVPELLSCHNDNEEIRKAFWNLGGEGMIPDLNNVYDIEEEDDEDYDEDDEDD